MLWSIAAVLAGLWCLALMMDFTMGLWIHLLIAASIILLIISIKQEVSLYDQLTETSRSGRHKSSHSRGMGF